MRNPPGGRVRCSDGWSNGLLFAGTILLRNGTKTHTHWTRFLLQSTPAVEVINCIIISINPLFLAGGIQKGVGIQSRRGGGYPQAIVQNNYSGPIPRIVMP